MHEAVTVWVPGRANLVGEHTDYNDGLCLPFAIGRGVTVRAGRRRDGWVTAVARDLGEEDAFRPGAAAPGGGWRAFVRGAVAELADAGRVVPPAHLEIESDLPMGAGLASSAALGVALSLALVALGDGTPLSRWTLARTCARIEHRHVGAETGLLDQLAVLFARPGHLTRLDLRDLSVAHVPLSLAGWRLACTPSGTVHEHAIGGYNDRRAECRRACALLGVTSLRDAAPADIARLPTPLDRRLRHVLGENERVDRAVLALSRADLPEVAAVLDASHASLRDDYEVSVPEVEAVVAGLRDGGAAGARMIGGGFGGSVLGLFPPGVAPPVGALELHAAGGPTVDGAAPPLA